MSYSHLQRRPETKREYQEIIHQWNNLATKSGDAKRQANRNGTSSEVQPYIDKMNEIGDARMAWLDQYDPGYNSLPD